MHQRLVQLLRELIPSVYGAETLVDRELLERGDEAAVTHYIRANLGRLLGDHIAGEKLLNGSDKSCFNMEFDFERDGMRCRARVHVLTPLELEKIVEKAFEAGRDVSRAQSFPYTLPRELFEYNPRPPKR